MEPIPGAYQIYTCVSSQALYKHILNKVNNETKWNVWH